MTTNINSGHSGPSSNLIDLKEFIQLKSSNCLKKPTTRDNFKPNLESVLFINAFPQTDKTNVYYSMDLYRPPSGAVVPFSFVGKMDSLSNYEIFPQLIFDFDCEKIGTGANKTIDVESLKDLVPRVMTFFRRMVEDGLKANEDFYAHFSGRAGFHVVFPYYKTGVEIFPAGDPAREDKLYFIRERFIKSILDKYAVGLDLKPDDQVFGKNHLCRVAYQKHGGSGKNSLILSESNILDQGFNLAKLYEIAEKPIISKIAPVLNMELNAMLNAIYKTVKAESDAIKPQEKKAVSLVGVAVSSFSEDKGARLDAFLSQCNLPYEQLMAYMGFLARDCRLDWPGVAARFEGLFGSDYKEKMTRAVYDDCMKKEIVKKGGTLFKYLDDNGFEAAKTALIEFEFSCTNRAKIDEKKAYKANRVVYNSYARLFFEKNNIYRLLSAGPSSKTARFYQVENHFVKEIDNGDEGDNFITRINGHFQKWLGDECNDTRIINQMWANVPALPPLVNNKRKYMPFTNGLLNLDTGKLEDYGERVTFNQLPYRYDEDLIKVASGPLFEHYLDTTILCLAGDDQEERRKTNDFIDEMLGSVISPVKDGNKALHLIGTQGTGKSTFLDIISSLIDKRCRSAVGMLDLADDKKLLTLEHSMLNISAEKACKSKKEINEETLKSLIGGEPVNVKEIWVRKSRDIKVNCFFVWASNESVYVNSIDSVKERFFVMRLSDKKRGTTKQIEDLSQKIIEQEFYYLLKRALRGLNRLRENKVNNKKYTVPAWIQKTTDREFKQTALTYNFAADALEWCYEKSGATTVSLITSAYGEYCKRENFKPANSMTFYNDLFTSTMSGALNKAERGRGTVLIDVKTNTPCVRLREYDPEIGYKASAPSIVDCPYADYLKSRQQPEEQTVPEVEATGAEMAKVYKIQDYTTDADALKKEVAEKVKMCETMIESGQKKPEHFKNTVIGNLKMSHKITHLNTLDDLKEYVNRPTIDLPWHLEKINEEVNKFIYGPSWREKQPIKNVS